MLKKKKEELRNNGKERGRLVKLALAGLLAGLFFVIVGQLLGVPAVFFMGYILLIVCTGISSGLIAFRWFYSKSTRKESEEANKPHSNVCPRCGVRILKMPKYCPKCGKQLLGKKRR